MQNRWNSTGHLYQAVKFGMNVMCLPEFTPSVDPCLRNRIWDQATPRGAKLTQNSGRLFCRHSKGGQRCRVVVELTGGLSMRGPAGCDVPWFGELTRAL